MDKTPLLPSTDHPITVEPTRGRVRVTVGGLTIADTTGALTLREAHYAPVQYIPLDDVRRDLLQPSTKQTYCPYKGDCVYFSVVTPDDEVADVVWFYPEPYPALADIAGRVAFYANRVSVTIDEQIG